MQMQLALDAGFPEPMEIRYDVIERGMLALPQVPTPTTHHFGPGLYTRQMFATAGTIVLGKEHRHDCMNIMLRGKCVLIDTDGSTRELTAPQMFVSPPGRKLAYVVEDMAWVNIWATDQTDIEALERDLFVDSEFAQDMAELGFTTGEVRAISQSATDLDLDPGLAPCVYLASSSIEGQGCFSKGEMTGDPIGWARFKGKRTLLGRYVNHSRTPNVEYRREGDDFYAYALRDIGCGEELTVDYRQARIVT